MHAWYTEITFWLLLLSPDVCLNDLFAIFIVCTLAFNMFDRHQHYHARIFLNYSRYIPYVFKITNTSNGTCLNKTLIFDWHLSFQPIWLLYFISNIQALLVFLLSDSSILQYKVYIMLIRDCYSQYTLQSVI